MRFGGLGLGGGAGLRRVILRAISVYDSPAELFVVELCCAFRKRRDDEAAISFAELLFATRHQVAGHVGEEDIIRYNFVHKT